MIDLLGPSVFTPPPPNTSLLPPFVSSTTLRPLSLSLFLLLLSHTVGGGGGLTHDRGIINFPEWQTLDVWRAVLSHPLPGVPQPPSLLPVSPLSPACSLPSRFHTLDAHSRVNDGTQSRFQSCGCAAGFLIFMFAICIKSPY